MRNRNSTQKHSSVTNGRRFQKSSTFLKRAFEKFTEFGSEVQVCGLWTDDEIVSQTISSPSSNEEEVDVPAEPNIIEVQAKDAVHILRRFMECSENLEKEDFAAIFRIENLVEKQFEKRCRQVTMGDFF
ncbi:hypothetical protein AVEN_128046-1 [Araneus ventricosus]|uniref:Uncharacterized protein n=1 Tax=Araneus ventricosus TaxID=182803 RepID=A0A4Y2A0L7_ARAVE|nr:hypothetical protein AVEN_128046-1 [Araneus ventricosus]